MPTQPDSPQDLVHRPAPGDVPSEAEAIDEFPDEPERGVDAESGTEAGSEPGANIFGVKVEQIEGAWCVTTSVDGRRQVVSRHRDETAANDAAGTLNSASVDNTTGRSDSAEE